MAEHKDDPGQTAKLTQSRKTTPSGVATEQADGRPESAGVADTSSATVVRRKQRYLIGFRSLPGVPQIPGDPFFERLAQMEGVEIIRRLRGSNSQAPAS